MGFIYFLLYLSAAWLISAVLLWMITRITWSGIILRVLDDGNFKLDGIFYSWKVLEILLGVFTILSGIALANRAAMTFGTVQISYVIMAIISFLSFYGLVVWLKSREVVRMGLMKVNHIKYSSHFTFGNLLKIGLSVYLLVALIGSITFFIAPSLAFFFYGLPSLFGL